MKHHSRKKTLRIIVVLFLYICFLSGTIFILQNETMDEDRSIDQLVINELMATRYLKLIYQAQQKYVAVDWDGDGKKTYAQFVAHLWQTVDKNANPINCRFIPRKLAFAMGESRAISGYYFLNVYLREKHHESMEAIDNDLENTEYSLLDYEKEWAVSAAPSVQGRTGLLSFVITNSGKVYAKSSERKQINSLPEELVSGGWKAVTQKNDIEKLHSGKR